MAPPASLLSEAWQVLGGDSDDTAAVTFTGPPGTLPARLPVTAFAQATAAAAALAAARLAGDGTTAHVDSARVAVSFTSERHLRVDNTPHQSFDPLSRYLPSADGWVRLHANYPHHRAALHRLLDVDPAGPDPVEAVAAAVARIPGTELEDAAAGAGALAYAVREPDAWAAHPQGRTLTAAPLLTFTRTAAGASPGTGVRPFGAPGVPCAGVRVLDLTRVVAGPVATRVLALLGADVLRLDPPWLPEIPAQHLDTGPGKHSALLDLRTDAGRERLEELLAGADVVVTGYRPGALDAFGLSPDDLAARHPGLITARVSAWGPDGPWAQRRGFDSLVQAPTGIARVEADGDTRPAALPAQALDHGTGHLVAAGVMRALELRREDGRGTHVEAALGRTAAWLMRHHDPGAHLPTHPQRTRPAPHTALRKLANGSELRYALPGFTIDGGPATWAQGPADWGSGAAAWQ